jgi:hypothetical protein
VVLRVYDRHGRLIDLATWEQKLADQEYRFVAQHWVRGWKVSTIWLGMDYNFGGGGPPLIFETMIFAPADVTVGRENALPAPADLDQYQERYPTEEAARAGHDRALAAMVAQLGDEASADIAGPLVDGSSDSTWDGTLDGET